jgi:RNA polymerase sigma-70 factor, ECF subfamily
MIMESFDVSSVDFQEDGKPTDEDLLLKYRETGDRDIFTKLVSRYEHKLLAYLRRYLGHIETAEDVMQDVWLQVHLKADTFTDGRKFRPWLYTIATNKAIDWQRRNKKHRAVRLDPLDSVSDTPICDLLENADPDPADVAVHREEYEVAHAGVDRLPAHQRDVVRLIYEQELKYCEAAEELEIPLGTVKSRMFEAMTTLRGQYARVFRPAA